MDADAPPRRRSPAPSGFAGSVRRRTVSTWNGASGAARMVARTTWERWRRLNLTQARVTLAALGVVAMAAGFGSAALALGSVAPESVQAGTRLGPVTIALPEELGPWTPAPATGLEALRTSRALGGTPVDGAWGQVAPGAVIVTVLTADAGQHAGLTGVTGPFDRESRVEWTGRRPHLAGASTGGGIRELVLVTQTDEGDLVLLSVSGPVEAFDSGALDEAFRSARIVD